MWSAGSAVAFVVVAWLPTMLLAVSEAHATGEWPPLALRPETHVRLLVAGPLLIVNAARLRAVIDACSRHLVAVDYVRPADHERFAAIAERTQRLRDSWGVRVAIGVVALAALEPVEAGSDLALAWDHVVGVTLFRFVLLRELWRWIAWAIFTSRVSRLDLALVATHPDRVGGLGFLCQPTELFGVVVLSCASVVAASWGSDVLHAGIPFHAHQTELAFVVVLMTALAVLPLLPFSSVLFRLRERSLRDYSAFARRYGARFEEKWIGSTHDASHDSPLGSPDIQSLADLATSFQVVSEMRLVLVPPRLVSRLALAVLLPMLPLLVTEVPVGELVPRLLKAM